MPESPVSSPTWKSRLAEELKKYALVSVYLFVCFSVLSIYEASQSANGTISLLTFGLALGKALVLGKFILIGDALKPGTRIDAHTVMQRIGWRTLGMLVVLVIFKFLEELIVGLVRGEAFAAILSEIAALTWLDLVGPVLVMLLILIPMIAAIELDRALENVSLREVLLGRSEPRDGTPDEAA